MAVSFRGVYPMLKNDVFCGHFVAIIAMATHERWSISDS